MPFLKSFSEFAEKIGTFEALRHRNYRYLWLGTAAFSSGYWVQQVVVGWLAYEITGSALITSIALGLDALPVLLGAPLGGLLTDRFNKKKLLIATPIYCSLLMTSYFFVVHYGYTSAWNLFLLVFLAGLSWIIHDPARMALLAQIVPKENLVNAFALNSMAFSVTRLMMPAIGGLLIALLGPAPLFLLEALLLGITAIIIMFIKIESNGQSPTSTPLQSISSGLKDGISYVLGNRALIGLTTMNLGMAIMVIPFVNGLLPVYAVEVYSVGPEGLGLLLSAAGVGSFVGTFILASFSNIARPGRVLFGFLGMMGILMALFGFNDRYFIALGLMMIVSGCMMSFFSVGGATVQRILDDKYRGRATGIFMMTWGFMPIGSLAAGILAGEFGASTSTYLGSITLAVFIVVCFYTFKDVWEYKHSPTTSPII